jgi:radical SAM protein with 4Fe4S-binding SPASM domain
MCPLNNGLKRKQGILKFNNFKKVFDQINPAYLNLTGIGEPFLNPELFKIIKYAKQKKAMVKLDTNGTLLNQENINKILDTKIDIISVSIDGTNKKSYEMIRVGSDFELIKKNIKNLIKKRNETKSKTRVHMFFVLQEKNVVCLPEFIKLAGELKFDYVAGGFVVTLGKNENRANKIFNYNKDVAELISNTKNIISQTNVEVSIDPLLTYLTTKQNKEFYNEKTPCYMPWYSTFITWDGWVNPCDFSCDNEIVFGNAFSEPFKKIWNNKKYKEFRKRILKKRSEVKICKGCSVDESYIDKEFSKIKKIPLISNLQYKLK